MTELPSTNGLTTPKHGFPQCLQVFFFETPACIIPPLSFLSSKKPVLDLGPCLWETHKKKRRGLLAGLGNDRPARKSTSSCRPTEGAQDALRRRKVQRNPQGWDLRAAPSRQLVLYVAAKGRTRKLKFRPRPLENPMFFWFKVRFWLGFELFLGLKPIVRKH